MARRSSSASFPASCAAFRRWGEIPFPVPLLSASIFPGSFQDTGAFLFPRFPLAERRLADVGRKSSLLAGYFGSRKADGSGGDMGQELCLGA